ncbi:MAG: 50S ribosomal protein L3 [Patescibacteria group bacterium]|jgi:large subunit ribosomal protein L3
MKFIIGTKKRMTQMHQPDGQVIPVTVIGAASCVVTAIRSNERDGYRALQVGTGKRKNLSRPLKGHFGKLGAFRYVREFRPQMGEDMPEIAVGTTLDLSQFAVGDSVTVTGTSKGLGFQGVVKRHGFHGGPKTHGHKDQLRMPGSIGAGGVQHVFKGKRMGGRMGGDRVTVKNLTVVAINPDAGEIAIKGAVPGAPRSVVLISEAQ